MAIATLSHFNLIANEGGPDPRRLDRPDLHLHVQTGSNGLHLGDTGGVHQAMPAQLNISGRGFKGAALNSATLRMAPTIFLRSAPPAPSAPAALKAQ